MAAWLRRNAPPQAPLALGPATHFTEAYWHALGRLVGEGTGQVLQKVLLAGTKDPGGAEWERVHEGMKRLLGPQAQTVLDMASREVGIPPDPTPASEKSSPR